MEPFFACWLVLMPACVSDRLPGGNPALVHYSGPFRWVGSSWTTGFVPRAQIHLFPAASPKPESSSDVFYSPTECEEKWQDYPINMTLITQMCKPLRGTQVNFTLLDRFLLLFHFLVLFFFFYFLHRCNFWAAPHLFSCRQLSQHPQKHKKDLN